MPAYADAPQSDTSNNYANSNASAKKIYSRWQAPSDGSLNATRPPVYSRWLLPYPSDTNTGNNTGSTDTNTGTGNANTGTSNAGTVGTGTGNTTNVGGNATVNDRTPAPYVAPIKASEVVKPNYDREVSRELVNAQPRPSVNTRTGYSTMDTQNEANLTEKFYGTSEDGYAERLRTLKTTIDTRNEKVGVIDTGINRNNRDLIGANVHHTQIRCNIAGRNNCYLPENDSGIVEVSSTFASGDHGVQMASVIAGNNGMTNAKIYGSDSIDSESNGGNQFLMMRKLNEEHGVKIFNNSWGSNNTDRWYRDAQNANYNATTGEVLRPRYSLNNAYITLPVIHDLILNRDALIIKATGNEGQNDAHDENLAPLINSNFKKGFITVSSPREDFEMANHCGRTAEWCVSATSSTQNYANNGRLSSYKGTSPATARVTGTAVLVKAAYPWMKNENISQTILGTAKDFAEISAESATYRGLIKLSRLPSTYRGDYYTDNRGNFYIPGEKGWENRRVVQNHNGKNITWEDGWGLLDPETAAKGYGGFYWDNVVLDTDGIPTSVFYNNLKGTKGFTKKGEGKLVFTGNNTYTGDSIIEGGSLEVNGNNGTSHMKVNGGELTGFGQVGKVTQTDGWVSNEGNLKINGDYTANIATGKDAGLKVKFGNLLSVTGKAKVGGTITLTGEAKEGIITQTGSRTTVLRADKGLEGSFEKHTSSNPLFEVTKVEYTPKADDKGNTTGRTNSDVQVTAKRLSAGNVVSGVGTMPSGRAVANNLDKVLNTLDKKQETQALSAEELGFARQVFSGFEGMTHHTMSEESPVLSVANTNKELFRLDPTVYANTAGHALDVSGTDTTAFGKKVGKLNGKTIWGGATHQAYDYELNHSSSDRKAVGFNFGGGTTLDSGVSVGAQLDSQKLNLTDSVYGVTNKADTTLTGLTVGASKIVGEKLTVLGWAKGATTKTESVRNGLVGKGDFEGKLFGAGVQVAGKVKLSDFVDIEPYAFIGHHNYKADAGYHDGINTIKELTANQTQVGIGADMGYNVAPNWEVYGGMKLTNAIKQDSKLQATYAGVEGVAVDFESWDTGKNQWSATVGTNYKVTQNTQVGVSYSHTNGKHNDLSQVGLSLTSKF